MGRARRGLDQATTFTLNHLPLFIVVAVFTVGVLIAWSASWRIGAFVIAGSMYLAGILRLLLDLETAGLLVVRSKAFDCALTFGIGVAITILALIAPGSFV